MYLSLLLLLLYIHTQIKIYIYIYSVVWKNSSSYFPTLLGITQRYSFGRAAVFYSMPHASSSYSFQRKFPQINCTGRRRINCCPLNELYLGEREKVKYIQSDGETGPAYIYVHTIQCLIKIDVYNCWTIWPARQLGGRKICFLHCNHIEMNIYAAIVGIDDLARRVSYLNSKPHVHFYSRVHTKRNGQR